MAKIIISTDDSEVIAVVEIDMVDWVNFTNQKMYWLEIKEWIQHIYDHNKDFSE